MIKAHLFRSSLLLSVAAGLAACETPQPTGMTAGSIRETHPIVVSSGPRSLLLEDLGGGISQEAYRNLEMTLAQYVQAGSGPLRVAVTPGAEELARYVRSRATAYGVPADSVVIETADPALGRRVAVSFQAAEAVGPDCRFIAPHSGDWTNSALPNFGCANQKNLSAMIANPSDLVAPQPIPPSGAASAIASGTVTRGPGLPTAGSSLGGVLGL